MATEEIQISQLELAQEVQGDMVFAVDTATDTKSLSVNQLKNHISQPLQANINAVDTSALHKYNISNCITEIPQDIKLELNNGTLTLKAGSKVYVPNGSGVFDMVTTAQDYTVSVGAPTGERTLFFLTNGAFFVASQNTNLYSGTTAPTISTANAFWYDTTNNLIKRTQDTGSTWNTVTGATLPIAIVTFSSGTLTSIDQVFNGFGYIGSTVFALPGVKGLIPNGRNADGTLKNTETTTNGVLTYTNTDTSTGKYYIQLRGNFISMAYANPNNWRYDEERNIILWNNTAKQEVLFAGNLVLSSGRVESLTPKTAFQAVDYNDTMLKEDWVKVSTVPASPDSSKFYYIPEN